MMYTDVTQQSKHEKTYRGVYTVSDIQQILGIGKNQAYALVKQKKFVSHEIGKKIIIPIEPFHKWLNEA